jgi:hypothetical protein
VQQAVLPLAELVTLSFPMDAETAALAFEVPPALFMETSSTDNDIISPVLLLRVSAAPFPARANNVA